MGGLELETIVARRIVTGGYHDAGRGLFVDDAVRHSRGRCIGARQPGYDAVAGHDPSGFGGVAIGQEACVKPNDDGRIGSILPFILHIVGDGLGYQPQVVEGEGVGYDGAPAVRSKTNAHDLFETSLPGVVCGWNYSMLSMAPAAASSGGRAPVRTASTACWSAAATWV